MDVAGWRTCLVVHADDVRTNRRVPIAIGLVDTTAGGVQIAMRVGLDATPMILTLQDATQLELNVRGAVAERYRLAIEGLDGDPP